MQHGPGPKPHSQPTVKQHRTGFLFDQPNVPFSQAVGSRVRSFCGGTPQTLLQSVVVQRFVAKFLAAVTAQAKNNLAFIICLYSRSHASNSFGNFSLVFRCF